MTDLNAPLYKWSKRAVILPLILNSSIQLDAFVGIGFGSRFVTKFDQLWINICRIPVRPLSDNCIPRQKGQVIIGINIIGLPPHDEKSSFTCSFFVKEGSDFRWQQ